MRVAQARLHAEPTGLHAGLRVIKKWVRLVEVSSSRGLFFIREKQWVAWEAFSIITKPGLAPQRVFEKLASFQ